MTIVNLARFQFAMTTVFHFFFVPFSIGTVFVVAIMESIYVHTKNEQYQRMAKFWGKIFLLSFAVGVVTGLIQEFQFGMNWSDYSRLWVIFLAHRLLLRRCCRFSSSQRLLACGCLPGIGLARNCTCSLFGWSCSGQ